VVVGKPGIAPAKQQQDTLEIPLATGCRAAGLPRNPLQGIGRNAVWTAHGEVSARSDGRDGRDGRTGFSIAGFRFGGRIVSRNFGDAGVGFHGGSGNPAIRWSWLVLFFVVLAMALLGLLATWIPARRALSVEPMILLREERTAAVRSVV
jgi:hypothetical protein